MKSICEGRNSSRAAVRRLQRKSHDISEACGRRKVSMPINDEELRPSNRDVPSFCDRGDNPLCKRFRLNIDDWCHSHRWRSKQVHLMNALTPSPFCSTFGESHSTDILSTPTSPSETSEECTQPLSDSDSDLQPPCKVPQLQVETEDGIFRYGDVGLLLGMCSGGADLYPSGPNSKYSLCREDDDLALLLKYTHVVDAQ